MKNPNGKETRKIRRTKGEGQYITDSDGNISTRPEGERDGSEPLRANRDNGQERKSPNVIAKQRIIGGIISRLLDEYREEVAVKRKELERLEKTIQYFESLEKEVEENIQDDT